MPARSPEVPAEPRPHRIRVRAFAKINLGLKVLGKRPDGYHELRTIYQTLALHDRLEVSLDSGGSRTVVHCSDPVMPSGPANLVHKACELWRQAREFSGRIEVRLEKKIPVGSGLGGGSSDAAATLLALERLSGDQLRRSKRIELAARLGSDVPLFFWGGRVLGRGRGEEVYPLWDLARRSCLVVFPGFSVSTAVAYLEVDQILRARRKLTGRGKERRVNFFGVRPQLPLEAWGPAENDFEEFVFAEWPELGRLKSQLIRAGAETASLTGSGSAVYALFDSAQKLVRASKLIPEHWETYRTRTLSRAEYRHSVIQRLNDYTERHKL